MVDVISGTDLAGEVIRLIESSRKILVLISPYFDAWSRLKTVIDSAAMVRGVEVHLLLRGGKDQDKQRKAIEQLGIPTVKVHFLDRLHAKLYINECEAIITSLNLLKSSALDSHEIGIKLNATKERELFLKLANVADELLKKASEEQQRAAAYQLHDKKQKIQKHRTRVPVSRNGYYHNKKQDLVNMERLKPKSTKTGRKTTSIPKGMCIRCAEPIKLNPDRPLCRDCYEIWSHFEDPNYREKVCHSCGKPSITSVAKPLCRTCFRRFMQ